MVAVNPFTVIVGAGLHTAVSTIIAPLTREGARLSNASRPYELPSIEAVLDAYAKGTLSDADTFYTCLTHGAAVPVGRRAEWTPLQSAKLQRRAHIWESVFEAGNTAPGLADTMELWVRGGLAADEYQRLLARNRVHDDAFQRQLESLQTRLPEPADIFHAFTHGLLESREAELALRARGVKLDDWLPYIAAQSEVVSAEHAIEYGKRGGADRDQLDQLLLRAGVSDASQRDMMLTLYQKLPTRADVGQWLQRNVFDQSYVTDFRLDEGFEERYWSRFSTILEAGGWSRDYAYLDYAAHWIVPATSQLAEMVQRLRPGRVDPALVYTAEDYERTLAEQDYAPYYRKRLLATSFRPLPIRFIRAAFQTDALSVQGVSESYQDQGYSREVADFMSAAEQIIKARARASQSRGWTPQAIARAFINGQTDSGNAALLMQELGFSPTETSHMLERATAEYQGAQAQRAAAASRSATVRGVLTGFRAGTVSAVQAGVVLSSLGWPTPAVDAILQATELAERAVLASRATQAVRRAYLRGDVSLSDARDMLVASGLDAGRVAQLTSLWPLELTPARKHVSAGQLRKGVLSGLVSTEQAQAALERLGYPEPDALLLVGEFSYDLFQQQIKLDKAVKKSAVGVAKDIDRLLALNATLDKKLRNALRKATPVGKLVSWFASGYIEQDNFVHRMSQMGYDDATTDNYLADAIAKRAKLEAKHGSAAPPGQSPGTNGTAGTGGTGGSSVPPAPPGS